MLGGITWYLIYYKVQSQILVPCIISVTPGLVVNGMASSPTILNVVPFVRVMLSRKSSLVATSFALAPSTRYTFHSSPSCRESRPSPLTNHTPF